jgi:hypothetical protein
MSDNMFHYADVPLSVIDNLINLEEDLQVLNRTRKFKEEINENYIGYKKILDSGWPIDKMSDSMQGHTNYKFLTEDEKAKAGKLFKEILKPIIGYEPNTQGRYGYYKEPIHIHNDGENYLGHDWRSHNRTEQKPRPANTTVFFPLRCYKEDGSVGTTETVYFDQKTPWSAKSGIEPENDDQKFYRQHGATGWVREYDYSDLVGYTDQPFDSDVWVEHLQHHPIEMLHGFSFAASIPWNIGQVVMFETSRIHCSSYMEDCFGKDCFLVKVNTDLWS